MIFDIKKEDNIDNNIFLEFDKDQHFYNQVPIYVLTSYRIVFGSLNFSNDICEVCNVEYFCNNDLLPIFNSGNNKVIGVFIKKEEYRKGNLFFLNNPVNEFIEEFNKINHKIIMNSNIKKKDIKMKIAINYYDIKKVAESSLDNLKIINKKDVDFYVDGLRYSDIKYFIPIKEGFYDVVVSLKNDIKDIKDIKEYLLFFNRFSFELV